MQIERAYTLTEAFQAHALLTSLSQYYPQFDHWYLNTVMPGVVVGSDVLLLAKHDQRLVGVALGKRTPHETKLRCVRVIPTLANSGLGIRLIDRMLDELACETPHCSVAEEMLHLYSRAFVTRYGFRLNDVTKGAYRPRKLEYFFN